MSQTAKDKELTGRHVLLMVIVFFGVLILINGIFIYQAVGTFRGEDVERSYRQGLDYNETLEARRAQTELGWQAQVERNDMVGQGDLRDIQIRLRDADGALIAFDRLDGRLRHPVDTALDIPIAFERSMSPRTRIAVPSGRWVLIVTAHKGDDSFTFRKSLTFE